MPNRHPTANDSQRKRRAKLARVDYYPSPEALAVMEAKRGPRYPLNIASGILDAILLEWDALINSRPKSKPTTAMEAPGISRRNARANESEAQPATCGARTRAGHPCKARGLPRTRRCKWHGGMSTGPKTPEGKARALANLRNQRKPGQGVGS